jgi:Holliday junction resolvase RusA-like endonuclease
MITTLTINEKVPSNNGTNGLLRMHWRERKKIKVRYFWLFRAQTQNKHTGRVKIHIQHYYRLKPIADYDNLVSTCKLLFDALKDAAVIVDDNQLVTGIPTFEQIRVKNLKDVKTVITVSDLTQEELDKFLTECPF